MQSKDDGKRSSFEEIVHGIHCHARAGNVCRMQAEAPRRRCDFLCSQVQALDLALYRDRVELRV